MLSTPEVCRRSRATYRQLDYWVRTGVIEPAIASASGSGSRRAFTEDQVRVVRMIGDLAALGAQGPVLARVVTWASLHPFEAWHGLAFVDDEGFVSLDAPGGSCWAIDLAECAACTAHSAVA